jgi:DNA-binding transcriptional ArsR family regulator
VQTYRSFRLTARRGLAALGDPTRRAIFEHLADVACAIGELAALSRDSNDGSPL